MARLPGTKHRPGVSISAEPLGTPTKMFALHVGSRRYPLHPAASAAFRTRIDHIPARFTLCVLPGWHCCCRKTKLLVQGPISV